MSTPEYEWARQRTLMKTLSAAPHLTRNFLNMQIWMSMTEDTKIKTYSAAPHMTRNFPNISIWMSIAEDTQRSKPFQLRLTRRDKKFSEHLVSMNELIKVRLDENLFSCSSCAKKFSKLFSQFGQCQKGRYYPIKLNAFWTPACVALS